MKYREINYLANSDKFKEFCLKYHLKTKVFNNEKLFLVSKCFVFEIYGLVVEDFFYFDLYSIDLKSKTTLNMLLADFDSRKLNEIYKSNVSIRTKVLIANIQGSEEYTLKAEQYFFTMFQIMEELLSKFMSCEKKIDIKYFTQCIDFKKKELENILKTI